MLIHTNVHEMVPAFKDWSGVSNKPCVENLIVLTINCNQDQDAFAPLEICQIVHYLYPAISKYSIGTGMALAVHQIIAVLNPSNEIVPTSTHTAHMLMQSVSVYSTWSMVHGT